MSNNTCCAHGHIHEHSHEHEECHGHEHCHCHEHEHGHDGCCCEHEHDDIRQLALRLVIGGVLGAVGFFLGGTARLCIFIAAYLILGWDVLFTAVRNIFKGKVFDENFLMSIATIGAFILGEYPEAAAVMLFYQIGELLSHRALEKSRGSIAALMDVRPDTAHVIRDGKTVTVACAEIKVGETVTIAAGERIPVDGVISRGEAMLDTSSLTGESIPRPVSAGDKVLAGMISADGSLEVTAQKEFGETTLSRILELAQNAQDKKSHSERFITSFARVYTPAVVAAAAAAAIIPPVLGLGSFPLWIGRALTFLVISCPCALVVSVPLTFFAGIGCASKHGVLIKNGMALENLSKIKTAAFDKTGTLTIGKPHINEIRANGSKARLLMLAAYAESDSTHPIARAVCSEWHEEIDRNKIERITEITARGVEAVIDGVTVLVGNTKLLFERGISVPAEHTGKNAVYVAADNEYLGYLSYSDKLKPDSKKAVEELSSLGISSVMLTGDSQNAAAQTAKEIGINEVRSELLPQDKAEIIGSLSEKGPALFVGDGINDAPSLATATVGMAMGGIGSDAAIESADAVIMGDEPSRIPLSVKLSRAVMRIVYQNTALAIGIKLAVMILSFFGIGGMWPAIFADVGVCLITVANSLRAYRIR